jgi:hypothetical protein
VHHRVELFAHLADLAIIWSTIFCRLWLAALASMCEMNACTPFATS